MSICQTCKKIVVLDDISKELRGIRREIYEAVAESGAEGISRDDLEARAYPNGPPRTDALRVHISNLNRQIAKHCRRVRTSRRKAGMFAGVYRLEEL